METKEKITITVEVIINAPVDIVWKKWSTPEDIKRWNNASDDWFTPSAENDLRAGGKFLYRMEAKDGSFGFDFAGVYDKVKKYQLIAYIIGDGRKVEIDFLMNGKETIIVESFVAETTNTVELQKAGWQSILNNFKKYVESVKQ